MQVASFVFNDFQENTYLAWDETGECVIIDPGCVTAGEQAQIVEFIAQNGLNPVKVLNTHCHIDHILGNNFLCDRYKIALYMHRDELKTYEQAKSWSAMLGVAVEPPPENRVYVNEGDTINFGNTILDIVLTPGHSIASVTFYNLSQNIAFAGDVLFYESIGRTDLPGGNLDTLLDAIRNKLFVWHDDVIVLPGHGPQTTVGHEKRFNPFLT